MNIKTEINSCLDDKRFDLLTKKFKENLNILDHSFISSLLIKVIMSKNATLLNEILTDINEINFFDKNKRTLLMYSCIINDQKIFDILFKKKQNLCRWATPHLSRWHRIPWPGSRDRHVCRLKNVIKLLVSRHFYNFSQFYS